MYIHKVVLSNISCFGHLEITLTTRKELAKRLMIVGDNGVGKTALLKSIAIGLCDESSAAGLLKESDEGYVRRGAEPPEGSIEISLTDPDEPDNEYLITTTICQFKINDERYFERVRQETTPPGEQFPWQKIFACGYGAGRGTAGTGDIAGYSVINAVYNMFNYGEGLQNPELTIRRLSEDRARDNFKGVLKYILMLSEDDSIDFPSSGIAISSRWGKEMPLRDLADGYRSSFLWLTDFLGWAFSFNRQMASPEDIVGIVLLDEIEQHLHPRWQRSIIGRLREVFPQVQFLATTHSPLCAIGTTALQDEECRLLLLSQQDGHVERSALSPPPRRQRADQVLTSYLFGLETTSDDSLKADIARYCYLMRKDAVGAEKTELGKLREKLNSELGSGETELERTVARAVNEVLRIDTEAATLPKEALGLEVKRQLRKLLEG